MTKKQKINVEQRVTDSILAALDKGVVPWRKPWKSIGGVAANLISKRPYRGVNIFILAAESMVKGYSSPYWVSFKQAKEAGGSVRKGEKGTVIIFWKPIQVEDRDNPGEKKTIRLLRHYYVWNVEQCDGLDHKVPTEDEGVTFNPLAEAEAIWNGYTDKPPVIEGGNRAAYSPGRDEIYMPAREAFTSVEGYYNTLFHEGVHSTGHSSRLNRPGIQLPSFGSDDYASEELVAEIGAAMLCAHSGIDNYVESSAAYIDGWRKQLSRDPKLIVDASRLAQKATDRILGTTFEDAKQDAESGEDS